MAGWWAVSSSSFPRTPLPTPATNSQLTSLVSYSSPHPLAGSPCSPSSLLMLPPTAQAASAPARSPEPRAVCKQPTLHPGPTAQITPSCYLCADLLSPRHKACLFLFELPPPQLPTRRTSTSKILKHLMNLNFLESLCVTRVRTIPGWKVVPGRYSWSFSAPAKSPLGRYS